MNEVTRGQDARPQIDRAASCTPRSGQEQRHDGDRMVNDRLMTICTATMAQSVTCQGGPMPEFVRAAASCIAVPIFARRQDRCGKRMCQSTTKPAAPMRGAREQPISVVGGRIAGSFPRRAAHAIG